MQASGTWESFGSGVCCVGVTCMLGRVCVLGGALYVGCDIPNVI